MVYRIEKSIEVNSPIDECYRALVDFAWWPKLSKQIVHVRPKGAENVWHWEVKGPSGKVLEWDIETDGLKHKNQIISWHTVRQADVPSSGAITMKSKDNGQKTQVHVVIELVVTETALSDWGAMAGVFLENTVEEGLGNLKKIVESHEFKAIKATKK